MGCLHAAALRVVRAAADQERNGSVGSGRSSSSSSNSGAGVAFALEPSVVAESSLRSLNYQSGIVLLEEMLLVRRGDLNSKAALAALTHASAAAAHAATGKASGSSSRRGSALQAEGAEGSSSGSGYDAANSDGWLQLSRLYAALGEKDVLVGLSLRAAQNEGTHEALRLELAGQYSSAINCYNQLIERQRRLVRKQKGGGGGGESDDEQDVQEDEVCLCTRGIARDGAGFSLEGTA